MDDTDLTAIQGVGDSTAEALREAGYESVADVATAEPADLETVSGLGDASAPEVAYNAVTLIWDGRELSQTADTKSATPTVPTVDGGGVTIELDIESDLLPFVFHALYEEMIQQHKRRDTAQMDEAIKCAQALAVVTQDVDTTQGTGDSVTHSCEVDISPSALTTMYRGLSRTASVYASESGISSVYGQMRSLAADVDEYR